MTGFDIDSLRGSDVLDQSGQKIGSVQDVFVDGQTREPEWLAVDTGILGRGVLIPLVCCTWSQKGVIVPHSKEHVMGSPRYPIGQALDRAQEEELYAYYGVIYGTSRSDTYLPDRGAHSADELPGVERAECRGAA